MAAAEPVGDPLLLWQAAQRLGIQAQAAAETDGLLAIGTRVTLRHPWSARLSIGPPRPTTGEQCIARSERWSVAAAVGDATSLIEEAQAVAEAIGRHFAPYETLALAVWRGREADASALIEPCVNEVAARGAGMGLSIIRWASAVLYNSLGRYEDG